jgi:hypothetical protein
VKLFKGLLGEIMKGPLDRWIEQSDRREFRRQMLHDVEEGV